MGPHGPPEYWRAEPAAPDSTVPDDAVATQDTVTQLITAIRRVIREVPSAAGEAAGEAAARCTAHDNGSPGEPRIAWDDEEARAALVDALVNDVLILLAHLPGLTARGSRRVPYRGIRKNSTWLHDRAGALHLRRLVDLRLTRTSDGTWALG